MSPRWETAEIMLANSQKLRSDMAAAVGKLDSYIELLKQELAQRDARDPVSDTARDDPPI